MHIAETAFAAFGQHHLCAIAGQISQGFAGVLVNDHGADRHAQEHVIRAFAVLIRTASRFAIFGAVNPRVAVVNQGVDIAVGNRNHTAAASAVTAVGAAFRHKFFAPKRRHAAAAVAGLDLDARFVNEFHDLSTLSAKQQLPNNQSKTSATQKGTTPVSTQGTQKDTKQKSPTGMYQLGFSA